MSIGAARTCIEYVSRVSCVLRDRNYVSWMCSWLMADEPLGPICEGIQAGTAIGGEAGDTERQSMVEGRLWSGCGFYRHGSDAPKGMGKDIWSGS